MRLEPTLIQHFAIFFMRLTCLFNSSKSKQFENSLLATNFIIMSPIDIINLLNVDVAFMRERSQTANDQGNNPNTPTLANREVLGLFIYYMSQVFFRFIGYISWYHYL